MANWITTTVQADNFEILKEKLLRLPTAEELKENRELVKGELIVDFNILIPQSEDLQITAGSYEWQTDKYGWGFNANKIEKQNRIIKPILDRIFHNNTEVTQAEFVKKVNRSLATHLKTFIEVYEINTSGTTKAEIKAHIENIVKGYYNLKKYGFKNWYDWSYENWGTKWNGGKPNYINESNGTIQFETANGLCLPVLVELSKFTPITVAYADEDTGSNYGILKIKDGDIIVALDDSNKSSGQAMAVRGDEEDYIDDLYGEDNYTDEEIKEYFKSDRAEFLKSVHKEYKETKELLAECNLF